MATLAVDSVLDNSKTDFDLYVEIGGRLAMYAKAPYTWLREETERLLRDGHRTLFYFTKDQARVEAFKAVSAIIPVDMSLPPPQRLLSLTDAAAELTRILYNHPLTEATYGKVRDIAKSMVETVEEDKSCISALGQLANHDYYTYYHSARVAAYSLAIAMQLTQQEPSQLTELATGALLHDVGKSKVSLEVLNKKGALTPAEWVTMKLHPVFGDQIVSDSLLSVTPRQIILHHHERFDGSGYPHSLTENELLDEVKIVAFADVFDALTANRPYQMSRTPFEALDFIRHKLLKTMHKESYSALVALLGEPPKPTV